MKIGKNYYFHSIQEYSSNIEKQLSRKDPENCKCFRRENLTIKYDQKFEKKTKRFKNDHNVLAIACICFQGPTQLRIPRPFLNFCLIPIFLRIRMSLSYWFWPKHTMHMVSSNNYLWISTKNFKWSWYSYSKILLPDEISKWLWYP